MEDDIADYPYRIYNYLVNQMFGMHSKVPSFLINLHQITTKSDTEAYVARLNEVNSMFVNSTESCSKMEQYLSMFLKIWPTNRSNLN